MENKEVLTQFFVEKFANKNLSLDQVLAECFAEYSNKFKDELADNFDLFRKTILQANNFDELEFYTKDVNEKLKEHIEKVVFPEYSKNDKGHSLVHIKEVIRRAFALNQTLGLNLNHNMIYAMAACHDWGKYIDHSTHEKIAANNFWADEAMKNFFNDGQRKIIKEAIEDHRSSFEDEPRSDYGKLISSADRNTRIEIVFVRSFGVGKWRTPEMTIEEFLDFTFKRLSKRYSEEDPENMFFADETYNNFLAEMRELLKHEKEFKDRYCLINNITNRMLTVEQA